MGLRSWASTHCVSTVACVPRGSRTFQLTTQLLAQHSAGQVLCLDHRAENRTFRLHAKRPDASLNSLISGAGPADRVAAPAGPALVLVEIRGVLEQRAGYHDMCGGWTDGHDAISERLTSAFQDGDVVLVVDSPGGAHAGLQEAVRRAQDAKAEHGRRVYAYANEQIGSAAYWWVAAIADEVYTPEAGRVGSIGARACHQSVAGALQKAGVEVTYFAWPGEGKTSFAPEMPLSDVAIERGNRDTAIAGEAFAEAVALGRGLSRDAIVALDADCLTGQSAVDAGLADGVASFEDVVAHALAIAQENEEPMATKKSGARAEEYEREEKTTIKERYEGDEPEAMDEPDEDDMDPEDMDEPEPDDEAEPDPEDEDDDEPEREAMEPGEPESRRAQAPRRRAQRAAGGLPRILGLRPDASPLAISTAVRSMRNTLDQTMAALEVSNIDELVGAARATAQDAKRVAQMNADLRSMRKKHNARRRMDLAMKLVQRGAVKRSDLFIDRMVVDGQGRERTKASLAPEWQNMRLSDFEGYAKRKLAAIGEGAQEVRRSTPFDADREAVKTTAAGMSLEAAMKRPEVILAAQRGDGDVEKYAKGYLATMSQGRDHHNRRQAGDPAI